MAFWTDIVRTEAQMRSLALGLMFALAAFEAPALAQSPANLNNTLGCGPMLISRDADAGLAAAVGALTRDEAVARSLLSGVRVETPENLTSCAMSVSERVCDREFFEFARSGLSAPNRAGNVFLNAIAAVQEPGNAAGAALAGAMTGLLAKSMGGDFLPWAGAGAGATAVALGFMKSYQDYAVACQGAAETFDAQMSTWRDQGRLRPVRSFDDFSRLIQANASSPDDPTARAMQASATYWRDTVAGNR